MKKNRMMRLASVLLVLTLLTTSVISGTFAKYVTTASSSDSARVARWGITMGLEENVTGNGTEIFVANYGSTVAGVNATDATTEEDVVAPGTSGSVKYVVDGTPETAYQITFDGTTTTPVDIYLAAGAYTYAADAGDNATYATTMSVASMEKDYYPLDWQVTIATTNGTVSGADWVAGTSRQFATLSAAMTALNAAKVDFAVNEECDLVVTIEWEWDFDSTTGSITEDTYTSSDVYDTILGDLAANNGNLSTTVAKHLNVSYTLTMTATQVD